MTVSAPIAGTLRTVPDTASVSSLDSGALTHANFRSVLDQYHSLHQSNPDKGDAQGAAQQKESDPTRTLDVPLPVTPAVAPPRLILPLTASITLRQGGATLENHPAAAQELTLSAETDSKSSQMEGSVGAVPDIASVSSLSSGVSTHANLRSGTGSSNQQNLKGSAPTQTAAAWLPQVPTAELTNPILPFTSSTTLEQGGTAIQERATVAQDASLAPETLSQSAQIAGTVRALPDTISVSTLNRGVSAFANSRRAAYQYRSSREGASGTVDANRDDRQQRQQVSDPTQTSPAPMPVTQTLEPPRPIHPPNASITPQQDGTASQSSSAVPQYSAAAPETDSSTIMRADDTTATPPTGSLAFAARLSLNEEAQPVPAAIRTADPQPRAQTPLQIATPVTAKQIASEADLPPGGHASEGGSQSEKEKASDRFAKPDALPPQTHAAVPDQTVTPANNHAPTSPLSAMARMDQVLDPPAAAPSTNHDITIRIPDLTDQGTAVRFVERAGEVHVSVRTGDVEMAQTLRGGLNDLVNRLEDGGIRTQVWQPDSDASTFQNDSHHPFADPDGSNGRQYPTGSNSEQESRQQNKPRWVEKLESSIGNPNFKETTQLLWQA